MIQFHTSDTHIATLRIEARAVNPLSRIFQCALEDALERLEAQRPQLAGAILSFEHGAAPNAHELEHLIALTPDQAGTCMATLAAYNGLLRRLETLGKPVVAALDGALHGHTLGLALACHWRVALADATLALPQVALGLVPAGGALVRSVRTVGLQTALPLLVDGATLDAAAGLRAGLLQAVAADPAELALLARGALEAGAAAQPWDQKQYRMPGGAPGAPQLQTLLQTAPALLRARSGGHYPAPEAILCAMVEGAQVDFNNALLIESRYFCHVATGAVAKNLLRLALRRHAAPAQTQALELSAALLAAYHAEAALLTAEGLAPGVIDNAARAAGLDAPPAWAKQAQHTGPAAQPLPLPLPLPFEDARDRLLYVQCALALAALARPAAPAPWQLDLASVELAGFPSWTGGAAAFAAHTGAAAFAARAAALTARYGERFALSKP